MQAFSELLKSLPLDSVKKSITSVATAVGLKTENWAEGGFSRTLVALFGQLYKTASDVVAIIAASGFLDTAERGWLTLLAYSVFRVSRIEATYASAVNGIKLTNGGGGLYTFAPGDIVVAHASTGKTYRNTTGGTLNPGVGQILRLDLAAEEPGIASNASVGEITQMVTTFTGVTCTNEVALTGIDEESDPALRQRCRDSLALLSPGGPWKAYDFIARSAVDDDGDSLGVTRVLVAPAVGDGNVDVYVAGASGAIGAPSVAIVQADFDAKVTPYGFTSTALDASNHSISAPCTVWIPASLGMSTGNAQTAVDDALREYVEAVAIGGTVISPASGKVLWRALLGVVERSIPGMLQAQLVSEADIAIAGNEVPVWGGAPADVTVVQVS
jgi:uncharacterized phage protein gp47/JayE